MNTPNFNRDLLKINEGMGADDIVKLLPNVYSGLQIVLKRYMDLNEEDRHILALWIMIANFKDAFNTMPILYINASSGSGKTRLINLISALIHLLSFHENHIIHIIYYMYAKVYKHYVYNIYNMSKQEKQAERAIPKSVTISARHQRFIDDRSINLSKFLQKKLDEEIEVQGWKEPEE